jgi:ATP-dependent DNA ligase
MLPVRSPFPPMEAERAEALPRGAVWQYEPKWDGFRCLVFRDGDKVELQSKAGKSLRRYFPDMAEAFLCLGPRRFVLDGELIVRSERRVSFEHLLLRIHPSERRVRAMAAEHPAEVRLFDLLVDERGKSCLAEPLRERRGRLERFATRWIEDTRLRLSRVTRSVATASRWLARGTGDTDGVMAKRRDLPYLSGSRDGMVKVKRIRTADCVVGGFRYAEKGRAVGSLLLGLYNRQGLLDHVGFCSGLTVDVRKGLLERLESLRGPPGFSGRGPGGPSRWTGSRNAEWFPVRPRMVVEVAWDHVTGNRFRHGTRFLRWRPDKAPRQCTLSQIAAR